MFLSKILDFVRKHKLWFTVGLVAAVFTTTVVLLSINWLNIKIIYAAGSSAVAPLMEALNPSISSNKTKELDNIDLNVSATGSGNGIEVVVNGTKHIGNVSRFPKVSEAGAPSFDGNDAKSGSFSSAWEDRRLKTVTLGWDAICIIYKPQNKNFELDMSENNITKIYEVISGTKQMTLSQLFPSSSVIDNTTLKPYARTGGALKSGTTEAFLKDSHLNFDADSINNSIRALETGSYGNNVFTTKESNIETWVQIRDADYGAITYLSGGFVLSNLDEINKKGFKIATYNSNELTSDSITNGYNWYRPFNSIVSLKTIDVNDYIKYWFEWVLTPQNTYVDNIFAKIGIIRLTPKQLNSMCLNNNFDIHDTKSFWSSDYALIKANKVIHYGAI